MNNYEKIKNMSVEDMAEFLFDRIALCGACPVNCNIKHIDCKKCPSRLEQWLQQEAD